MAVPVLAEFVSCFSLEIDAEIFRKWFGMSVPVLAELSSNVLVEILAEPQRAAVLVVAHSSCGRPAPTARPTRHMGAKVCF